MQSKLKNLLGTPCVCVRWAMLIVFLFIYITKEDRIIKMSSKKEDREEIFIMCLHIHTHTHIEITILRVRVCAISDHTSDVAFD